MLQASAEVIDISAAVVTAATQTYSGSAKTPTPSVVLDGTTLPSTAYDISYSNNTNAGTATITVTGKGDYTGTATGTFTIAKANPTYTAPTARTGLTYSGSSQYLVTAGSTSHGTIRYSSNGTSWSTTRPSSTNAGSYTTYWRLVGDSNHNDIASISLSTTIAKASRTLSFADAYVVLAPSGNITKTATPSAGSGDGAITYTISSTTYATINSSSGKVTAKTSDGSAIVTATIAEGTNYLSASASYNIYVFATTHNFAYTGSVQNIALPPGSYKLQCWGAQGGSNAADSGYDITAQAGGKGGYAEGVLTLTQKTTVRVYVGGQGSSSAGGYNGGGSTTGTSKYDSGGKLGYSKMGGGGGATDIRLSDGALLSRMIVAGGGSGGAMGYERVTTTTKTVNDSDLTARIGYIVRSTGKWSTSDNYSYDIINVTSNRGQTFTITKNSTNNSFYTFLTAEPPTTDGATPPYCSGYSNSIVVDPSPLTGTVPSDAVYMWVSVSATGTDRRPKSIVFSTTSDTTNSQVGGVGGGTSGGGYSTTYQGKQNAAGTGGSFGQGANQTATNYRYASGAGGGGWYGGGGGQKSDSYMTYIKYSGGGSGWVNVAESASNRPTGYTGLELDSGETKAGNTSFPSTSGGTETGHSGNGYAKITRLT